MSSAMLSVSLFLLAFGGGHADFVVEETRSVDEALELRQMRGAVDVHSDVDEAGFEETDDEETRGEINDEEAEWDADDVSMSYIPLTTGCATGSAKYGGHAIGSEVKVHSKEACAKSCNAYAECVGFDYYAKKQKCFLKRVCEGTAGVCAKEKTSSCGYKMTVTYKNVGAGYCRDAHGKRPNYYRKKGSSDAVCRTTCAADADCHGYVFYLTYCVIYAPQVTKAPAGWTFIKDSSAEISHGRGSPAACACYIKQNS